MWNPFKQKSKPISGSGAPEMGDNDRPPDQRIEHDAGLSPGAVQSRGVAGAALGGRKGSEVIAEDPGSKMGD